MTLSVVMITRNAGDVIEDALKSVRGLWDELLIDDDDGMDTTREIITKYGGVCMQAKGKNLGERKQALVEQAKGDWILLLDSDERVSDALKKGIRNILKNGSRKESGYRISYQNYCFGRPLLAGGEVYAKVRLFRKGKGRVVPVPLHEEVAVEGTIGTLKGNIQHYSYRSFFQVLKKFSRYAWLAAQLKQAHGEKVTAKKLFLYGPHMFWERYINDRGYRDGWQGLILASCFAYMEKATYWFLWFRTICRYET